MKNHPLVLALLMLFHSSGLFGQPRDPNKVKALSSNAFNQKKMPDTGIRYGRQQPSSNGAVKIYAVVVGVGNYTSMPPLQYTDDDAVQFYQHLKRTEGGSIPDDQIKLLVNSNATSGNVMQALRQLSGKADANDVFIFYFSGHGINGSFLPVDFDGYRNLLRHEDILAILESSRAKQKICIADACFSGALDNNAFAARGITSSPTECFYHAFECTETGTALLMSSNPGEVSMEDRRLQHGVFTYFLMRGLNGAADFDHNQIVTIQEIFHYVYHYVAEYTEGAQSPVLTGDYDNNMPVAIAQSVR